MTNYQPNRRSATISVQPYLAAWARRRFDVDARSGGIIIPPSYDLYHTVWQLMQKWPRERWAVGVSRRVAAPGGNLQIHLPYRRAEDGVGKNPHYWNYLSARSGRIIGRQLKRLFDAELHDWVRRATSAPSRQTKSEAVRQFVRHWRLGIDAEDALLKNLQRYERANGISMRLNKVKSAMTSRAVLSCPSGRCSGLADGVDDGPDLSRCERPLLQRVIAEGLELLGKTRTEVNPRPELSPGGSGRDVGGVEHSQLLAPVLSDGEDGF